MASVSTSTPLPSSSGLACQLVFLKFLNQLRTQHNITTEKDVQFCVHSFELVDQLLKQETCPEERDYHKLLAKYVDLQNSYFSSARENNALEERLEECKEKLSTLETQVKKEESARMVCERDAKLQEALEQTNEKRNCSCNDSETINQILTKLQAISSNQSIRKHIYMVENLLSLTKETIHMYAIQTKNKDHELKMKDDQLQLKDEDLKRKNHELKIKKDELKQKDDKLQKKEEDLKQKNHELKIKEDELKQKDDKLQKKEKELKEKDEAAKQQSVIDRKRITKVIEFTNKYRKYLASGTFNWAIAAHGDTELKNIFRPLQDIVGERITEQDVRGKAYSCENGTYIPWCFLCDGIDDCGNQEDEHLCSTTVFRYGARVKPGPDWDYAKRGGDRLMVGTVTGVQYSTGVTLVKWDNGNISDHNISSGGKMELGAVAGYFCN